MRKKICIALAIIWMGVIFYMSNQPASISSIHSGNTINIISKLPIIGNIMDYLTSINIGEFIVRKCAHMFSYCILAIFLFMSVYEDNIKKAIIIAFLGTFLYACSDEFHQLFIPGRSGEFRDVMIDSTGGIIGIVCAAKGKKAAKLAGVGTGLGTAGLVLSIIGTALAGIGFFSCTLCVLCAAGTAGAIDTALLGM